MGRLTHRTGAGFTYFVTTKCWENRAIFQVRENAEILIECMLRYRDNGSFLVHEFVVMPNHLHVILTPAEDTSLERAMQLVKGGSSYDVHQRRELRLRIWQPGFHEESIRDSSDYQRKAEYIRMNPVHSRLVERPEEWPYSSASGHFGMDPIPERLKAPASVAKAAHVTADVMSELKLRPPKNQDRPGLKSRPPENPNPSTPATLGVESRPPENENLSAAKAAHVTAGVMSELKLRPLKNPGLKPPPAKGQGA